MLRIYYLLLMFPYLIYGNLVCFPSDIFDDRFYIFEQYKEKLRGKSDVQFYTNEKSDKQWARIIDESISYTSFVNLRSDFDTTSDVYFFRNWFVPRFRYNFNVVMLDFQIPQDTRAVFITLIALESDGKSIGGECESKSIEIVLKPRGFPLGNITMPDNFIYKDDDTFLITINSNETEHTVRLENPLVGDWYGRVYKSWTNPKDDGLTQKGIGSSCQTFISGRISAMIQPNIKEIDCRNMLEINLGITDNTRSDIYKCYMNSETTRHELKLSVNLNKETEFVLFRLDVSKLPSISTSYQCALKIGTEMNPKLSLIFTPYMKKWHYLEVIYGKSASNPILNDEIEYCENIDNSIQISPNIHELVRAPRDAVFSFGHTKTDFLIDITSGEMHTLKFNIFPTKDMGGTLSIEASFLYNESLVDIIFCFGRNAIITPNINKMCESDSVITLPDLIVSNDNLQNMTNAVHIPYPELGLWYITFKAFKDDSPIPNTKTTVDIKIYSSPCSASSCGPFGSCQIIISGNLLISACRCNHGFTGWLCSDDFHVSSQAESLTIILLLTLSNLFFTLSIVFAIRRKYYTEALVYAFTMFFSTFYHACDSTNAYYGLCITNFGVLQYADFFCGVLSFWVTLVAIASVNTTLKSLLHMLGVVVIAFITEWDRFSLLLFLIPIISGILIMLLSWIIHCKRHNNLFPGKKYLMFFFPAGILLGVIGLVCFAFLQTNSNYHIVHSIWHVLVALSVLMLLPIRRFFFIEDIEEDIFPADELTTVGRSTSILFKP